MAIGAAFCGDLFFARRKVASRRPHIEARQIPAAQSAIGDIVF